MKPYLNLQELADLPYFGDATKVIRKTVDPNWKRLRGNLTEGEGHYCVEFRREIKTEADKYFDIKFDNLEESNSTTATRMATELFEMLDIEFDDEEYQVEQDKTDPLKWTVWVYYVDISNEEDVYHVFAHDRADAFTKAEKQSYVERGRSADCSFIPIAAYRTDLDE